MTDPVVELRSGFVRGLVEKHEDGFDYYSFKNIPYAEPPIGELIFKDPVPIKKWSGKRDCKAYGSAGFQIDLIRGHKIIDDNCLNLNVFTRSVDQQGEKSAILVWLHGGDFTFGSSDDSIWGPNYLIRKNIVLVTVDYRLGVLGFLDLEDEVAPGNQGLKDQVMALQWIQQNIRAFCGDPGNVTVGGISAGGASAHYLAISPLGKGLFHRIIAHGNTTYNPWVGVEKPRQTAIKLCSLLGKELSDSREIVEFLKTIDRKKLLDAQHALRKALDYIPFGPGLDSKSPNPFMPVHRDILADQGIHVPSLVGYNSRGGIFMLLDSISSVDIPRLEIMKMCNEDFDLTLIQNSKQMLTRYGLHKNQLRRLYYKNETISDKNLGIFADLLGDLHFTEGVHRYARVQAEQSSAPTYLYRFSYDSPDSWSRSAVKDVTGGASHGDELPYLFKMESSEVNAGSKSFVKGSRSYKIMEQMTEMWTNFVKYGRPTIEISDLIPVHWKPIVDGKVLRLLNIDEDLTMQSILNVELTYLSARDIQV